MKGGWDGESERERRFPTHGLSLRGWHGFLGSCFLWNSGLSREREREREREVPSSSNSNTTYCCSQHNVCIPSVDVLPVCIILMLMTVSFAVEKWSLITKTSSSLSLLDFLCDFEAKSVNIWFGQVWLAHRMLNVSMCVFSLCLNLLHPQLEC